eukprot:gene8937-9860_t
MLIIVDYEGAIYECSLQESMNPLNFDTILGQRPLINCWLEDSMTKVWIRVPRIEVLRLLIQENSCREGNVFKLRFQSSNKSPNATTPQLTPTVNIEDTPETAWALSAAEMEEVDDMDDMVVIQQESDQLFDAEKGISPFDVVVTSEDQNHQRQEVKLTRQVWMKCLLRGNPKETLFMDYISARFQNVLNRDRRLIELHNNVDLWLRLKCFHYDLMHFNEEASSRLQGYGGEYYMSNRYFSSTELDFLLNFPTASGATARQSFQILFSSKGQITEVCTSHDIAPAMEKIFGIRKGFEDEKAFKEYFKKFSRRTMLF